MSDRCRLVALTGLLAMAGAARAQSLATLYDAAHAYDATYLSARALYDSTPYRIEQTEALLRPSAGATASAGRTHVNASYLPNTNYGNWTSAATVNGRQPLFNPGNVAAVKQAERSLDSAAADLDTAEQDLILRLAQAYFDVLSAEDTLRTTRANKTAIAEQLASAKRNFEVGTATITDTREAQARYDLATAQEIAAENDLHTKRIALDQLVGRQNVRPFGLTTPVALPAIDPANADDWVHLAETQHPAIRRAVVALDVARLEVDKARAARYPTVDAVGSVASSRGPLGGIVGSALGTTSSASVGVQLNMTLYSGGAISNRISETEVLAQRAQDDLDAARRNVTQATRQAYYTLASGIAQVKALEAAEASSQLALEATQLGYRVGVRVNIDVLNAQTQLYQTQRDLARARYDVLVGSLRLRQAAGRVTAQDVASIDRLLQEQP
ncbi:MAG TPA: TolC family outer membrane protein [Caldimonas sp.]|nr:TolC family outer membrane protein [Caldimonas sp.]